MLLAVLGLAQAGNLQRNEIRFEPPLLERYHRFFAIVRGPTDHPNPHFPFFHMCSEGFWHLRPIPNREHLAESLNTVRSTREITANFEYAYLDDELHRLVLDAAARAELRDELLVKWFGSHRTPLEQAIVEERKIDAYEVALRATVLGSAPLQAAEPSAPVRSTAFRRIVSEMYDFRCAASGWRIMLPDSRVMVEAAHLIPFSESHDDDPRNGIALVPSFHWALDAYVIAPGPDYKWHVSQALDDRLADNRPLLDLDGRDVILPRDRAAWPKKTSLEWRLKHLLKS